MLNKNLCNKLKEFRDEEAKTSKLYSKMGFKSQASDELKHSKFFGKQLNLCKKNK